MENHTSAVICHAQLSIVGHFLLPFCSSCNMHCSHQWLTLTCVLAQAKHLSSAATWTSVLKQTWKTVRPVLEQGCCHPPLLHCKNKVITGWKTLGQSATDNDTGIITSVTNSHTESDTLIQQLTVTLGQFSYQSDIGNQFSHSHTITSVQLLIVTLRQ